MSRSRSIHDDPLIPGRLSTARLGDEEFRPGDSILYPVLAAVPATDEAEMAILHPNLFPHGDICLVLGDASMLARPNIEVVLIYYQLMTGPSEYLFVQYRKAWYKLVGMFYPFFEREPHHNLERTECLNSKYGEIDICIMLGQSWE